MLASQGSYVHRSVSGLPLSLMQPQQGTVRAIAMMQKAGLNRERRRELIQGGAPLRMPVCQLAIGIAKNDKAVLKYYISADERFNNFWYVIRRKVARLGFAGGKYYALAIDYQLFQNYDPSWGDLQLDDAVLADTCDEWLKIKERLQRFVPVNNASLPLGMFMLWPRIVQDIEQWDTTGSERQQQLSHAVFALSSIGWTGWFIDRAIALCPALAHDLGALQHAVSAKATFPQEEMQTPVQHAASSVPDSTEIDSLDTEDSGETSVCEGSNWNVLLERLDVLAAEIKANPTQEAVADLQAVAEQMHAFGSQLPKRERPVLERFELTLASLIDFLEKLSQDAAFAWLDPDLIVQLDARWRIAMDERMNLEHLDELDADASAALVRCQEAAQACTLADRAYQAGRVAVQDAGHALNMLKGFAEKAVARRKLTTAQQQEIELHNAQLSAQEALIDAASPFKASFDYSADYCAQRSEELPIELVATTNAVVSLSQSEQSISEPPQEPVSTEPLAGAPSAPDPKVTGPEETTANPLSPPLLVVRPVPVQAQKSTPLSTSVPAQLDDSAAREAASPQPYNEEAGELCRPIWQHLLAGRPALSYQATQWIQAAHKDVRVPPPELLAAVALAEELMLPDGGIQAELGEQLKRLDLHEFSEEAPAAWHAALNLLLAAATLRPMVLAPNSNAASVASYLHQDGHYPALYALVQKLRDLSARLVGFRIEPTALHQARGEASIRSELKELQLTAGDWLKEQAPAYTIKFQAATNVWRQWLRPGGEIDALVAPVVHNRVDDAQEVRKALAAMSNPDHVHKLIHETDRRVLKRTKGEEIHSGALDHLRRNIDEAMRLPRLWLALVDLLGRRGDRLRELLEQVNAALREDQVAVERELLVVPENDEWNLVASGQQQALCAVRGLISLFDAGSSLPEIEPSPAEVLSRDLLRIADISVAQDWSVDTSPEDALVLLRRASAEAMEPTAAVRERLVRGDVLGAELMVESHLVSAQDLQLRADRERWKAALRREIAECRRSVEVGSAYGYLVDSERGQIESELAQWEAQIEELRRFDTIMARIKKMRDRVTRVRDARAEDVRATLRDIAVTPELEPAVADIHKSLAEGDIATASELVHWLAQGKPTPTELDDEPSAGFDQFFPAAMLEMGTWLGAQRRDTIEQALRTGSDIPGLEMAVIEGAQREQTGGMYVAWADMKAQQAGEESRLSRLLSGLGFTVKEVQRVERVAGREVWNVEAEPIADRHICPLPMYGSAAGGKYRLICAWGRPTEDELLQWVGDTSTRPALLFYFGQMNERKWRDLSRLTRAKRRSVALMDETLLVFVCRVAGSRLRTWLDTCMPFSYASPYDASAGLVPPEMFYGRGEELDAVRGLNGRCFIYGGRQLGKTALLKRAEQSFHQPSQGRYARWIDLRAEGIGVSVATSEIWLTLHDKLRDMHVIDAKLVAPVPGKRQGVDTLIRAIREFIDSNPDRRLLLLLDEADRFFEQDGRNDFEETRRLKQLMDETQRRFKVVFAGLHNVLRMTERPNHPLAHFGEPIEIGPLREGREVREAANLIRRPMAAAGFSFESRGLVIRILAQTNYYPSLIQLYCSHLSRHMLAQVGARPRQNGPRYIVGDRDIEQVYSSDALRDEIRAKFRLTLQLDPRYEVLAYTMALDLLRNRYSQSVGMAWQTIRQAGALHWWAEGFRETSETDFQVLLNEMVGLGVLRRLESGRYELRNPNVLLLLGTQEEIEAVLNKDREPAVEFESASFRPPLSRTSSAPGRSVFTYQQLSRLLQRSNGITVVTGTRAAGIDHVTASLEAYLGPGAEPVVIGDCADRQGFGKALHAAVAERPKDQVSVFIIPEALPWTHLWLKEAHERLQRLQSPSKFASVVFVADPATLWRLLIDETELDEGDQPWMSLLPWRDGFLRHWLDERQLQLEQEDRRRLSEATGLWPTAINELAGECTERRTLRERMKPSAEGDLPLVFKDSWAEQFGLTLHEPTSVIDVLARLGEPVTADDLAAVSDIAPERVAKCLRWGELLGMTHQEGAGFWSVDPLVARLIVRVSS